MSETSLTDRLVGLLSDPDRAVLAAAFPTSGAAQDRPGLYSWWASQEARSQLGGALGADLPALIYAGQAGAASSRSRRVGSATLRSRITTNHLRGNIGSSTFRLTLAACLRGSLNLEVTSKGRLEAESNLRLSAWIRTHLAVATVAHEDRMTLMAVEDAVLQRLDPPLNLKGMAASDTRRELSRLRRAVVEPERPLTSG